MEAELWTIFANASLPNNFVFAYFLGISGKLETSIRMARAGFTLAFVLMAGIREGLPLAGAPDVARGIAGASALAGILLLAFMGFAGLGS